AVAISVIREQVRQVAERCGRIVRKRDQASAQPLVATNAPRLAKKIAKKPKNKGGSELRIGTGAEDAQTGNRTWIGRIEKDHVVNATGGNPFQEVAHEVAFPVKN